MFNKLLTFRDKHPFITILLIAVIFRFVAVIFSQGYSLFNEHFLYIETPYMWLTDSQNDYFNISQPEGTSLLYVSFNYIILGFFRWLGIYNPMTLMFFNRLIHAVTSLFVISFGYRMASLITQNKTAYYVALALATAWFMPYVSVHNCATFISVPFLMYGSLIILKQEIIRNNNEPGYHRSSFITAGFFLGMAFSIWYQNILYIVGIVLALTILKNYKGAFFTFLGTLISVAIFQTIPDLIVWGQPFAEMIAFFSRSKTYLVSHPHVWFYYSFLMAIIGLIIPISLMMFWGFFKNWKKYFLLFLPVFLFFVFYTIWPNENELYILPIIPMFIVLGISGWMDYYRKSKFWNTHKKFHSYIWQLAFALNLGLLLIVTPAFTHKVEVNAMNHLRHYNVSYFIVENTTEPHTQAMPLFYAGSCPQYTIVDGNNPDLGNRAPDFVLFYQTQNIEQRVAQMKTTYPTLAYETTFRPHFLGTFFRWLKHDKNDGKIVIYRNVGAFPNKYKK